MHNKNNNKSQTYIQGLRPFSSSIPKTLKKHLRKGGYNYSNIVDNWTKIVSKNISDACYPTTVKMTRDMKHGALILNVIHGKELEVEYAKNEIIDKKRINKILKNIKSKSIKKGIDPKISSRIWKNMIYSFVDFEYRNFKKKK